jgi:hypothetical protein
VCGEIYKCAVRYQECTASPENKGIAEISRNDKILSNTNAKLFKSLSGSQRKLQGSVGHGYLFSK